MKQPSPGLTRRYASELRRHLNHDGAIRMPAAARLGRQMVALGLTTLDLARIHEEAMATLLLPGTFNGSKAVKARRAASFFAKINLRVEEPGRTEADFIRLEKALGTRTKELAAAKLQVREGVARRKAMEGANDKRRVLHKKCLDESLRLQRRLRRLTHQVLAAHEDDRKTISRKLQDDIAQTLIGINVRLLTLQKEARGRTKRFNNDIASTRRAVIASAKVVRQVARKFVPHEP